ncbi:MAG TPA: Do family serine endopeptidase [Bryobacteraceae bacterium]|nr:Do family serine endopeptidase [Bryobacteraceae bacterium]
MSLLDKVRRQKLLSLTLLLVTLSVGIVIGTLISTGVSAAKDQPVAPDATPLMVPPVGKMPPNQFVELAKRMEGSVVNISTEYSQRPPRGNRRGAPQEEQEGDEEEGLDLFRRFFRQGPGAEGGPERTPRGFRRSATGSGFIVDKNGYIITNHHVIEKADQIRVKIPNDTTLYKAKLIGHDEETDLAVIKIDARRALPVARIGNSDAVQVGDWAIAIGSPFGLEATVTAGIVSATGRDIDGAQQFQHFIQTDAAINPGNSGGPLLNINGEVIGINTAIATQSGGYQGVGFALPVNMAAVVYNSVIKTGRMSRGSIGITFRKYDEQVLKGLGLKEGVIVESVNKGGPAETAGMKAEDVIVALNGKAVKDGDDLVERVSSTPVGQQLTVTVDRGGKRLDLRVAVGDREEQRAASDGLRVPRREEVEPEKPEPSGAKFGLRIRPANDSEREAAGVEKGVVVTTVEDGSFAEEIGLQERDVLVSINRQAVGSIEDVRAVQGRLKPGDAVAFRVMRPSPFGGRQEARQYVGTYVAGTLPSN